MATTNLNMTTIAGTDIASGFPTVFNSDLEKIDTAIGNILTNGVGKAALLVGSDNLPVTISENMINALEASYQAANEYSSFIGGTSNGSEMGWWGFKRTNARAGYALLMSINFGLAMGFRSSSGSWKFKLLMSPWS